MPTIRSSIAAVNLAVLSATTAVVHADPVYTLTPILASGASGPGGGAALGIIEAPSYRGGT